MDNVVIFPKKTDDGLCMGQDFIIPSRALIDALMDEVAALRGDVTDLQNQLSRLRAANARLKRQIKPHRQPKR